jgi:predicted PurR-regulated permease PerM
MYSIVHRELWNEVTSVKYFWTFFWALLLMEMLNYVVNSMNGTEFNFMMGVILAVVVTVLLFVMAALIPNEDSANEH